MFASAMRNSMIVVASNVCSDSVALASVASSDCARAAFSSIRRRTWPQMSGVQLAVPSSVPEVVLRDVTVVAVVAAPVVVVPFVVVLVVVPVPP